MMILKDCILLSTNAICNCYYSLVTELVKIYFSNFELQLIAFFEGPVVLIYFDAIVIVWKFLIMDTVQRIQWEVHFLIFCHERGIILECSNNCIECWRVKRLPDNFTHLTMTRWYPINWSCQNSQTITSPWIVITLSYVRASSMFMWFHGLRRVAVYSIWA